MPEKEKDSAARSGAALPKPAITDAAVVVIYGRVDIIIGELGSLENGRAAKLLGGVGSGIVDKGRNHQSPRW